MKHPCPFGTLVREISWNKGSHFPCSLYLVKCFQLLGCKDIVLKQNHLVVGTVIRLSFHTTDNAYLKFFHCSPALKGKSKEAVYALFMTSALFRSEVLILFNIELPLPTYWDLSRNLVDFNDLFVARRPKWARFVSLRVLVSLGDLRGSISQRRFDVLRVP